MNFLNFIFQIFNQIECLNSSEFSKKNVNICIQLMKTRIVLFEIFPNLNNKINIFESILSTHISA